MFLGDIVLNDGQGDDYEIFHSIISDFKHNHDLIIMSIKTEDGKLKYELMMSDGSIIAIYFWGSLNLAMIRLEMNRITFDEFSEIYKDLEKISYTYFDKKRKEKIELF